MFPLLHPLGEGVPADNSHDEVVMGQDEKADSNKENKKRGEGEGEGEGGRGGGDERRTITPDL